MIMNKILVPTNLSPAAKVATDVALSIAAKENVELVLLHIVGCPRSQLRMELPVYRISYRMRAGSIGATLKRH